MADNTAREDEVLVVAVKDWINRVIVALNFCPFAKKEVQRDTISYTVSHSLSLPDALSDVLEQLTLLDQQQKVQTSLLIFAQGFGHFDPYLDLVDAAIGLIEQGGYRGLYQIASFHPQYCFAGEESQDPANYTNRSPYPILHFLRESSVQDAVSRYPEPESIPVNNIAKARSLGSHYLQALLDNH
jgi:hypothetical protein